MVPETMPEADVHAHAHRADQAQKPENPWGFGSESASTPASRDARVIPINRRARQESAPEPPAGDRKPETKPARAPAGLRSEAGAVGETMRKAAENSVWATEAMTAVDAWKRVAPGKGEAENWIFWTVMTAAGVCRAAWNSLGHLILLGTDTRIKAGVATAVLLAALVTAFLAGHATTT